MMQKTLLLIGAALCCVATLSSCEKEKMDSMHYDLEGQPLPTQQGAELATLNLSRAITLADSAFVHNFSGNTMKLLRYYNPITKSTDNEVGSVWMYTSAIEAVNGILESLKDMQKQVPDLYAQNYERYVDRLTNLYDGLEYYAGTYTLTSYTQTKKWTVYSVNRADDKGGANVTGVLNVYDDQQWIIRELLRSYKITGNTEYLAKAEYLTRTFDETGVEVLKKAIEQDIHKFSHIPCMTDESFGGNVSGVAMEFKVLGMENITKIKTRYYKKGLRKRLRLFCGYLSLYQKNVDPKGITMVFTRSLPKNLLEISQIVANLWGKVSRRTLLSQIPFVEDVDEELNALEKETQENLENQQKMFGNDPNTPPDSASAEDDVNHDEKE